LFVVLFLVDTGSDGENDGSSEIDEQSDYEQDDAQEADSFIMNTPESLDDRDEVDFDMEVRWRLFS
jgi:hypothetical protein